MTNVIIDKAFGKKANQIERMIDCLPDTIVLVLGTGAYFGGLQADNLLAEGLTNFADWKVEAWNIIKPLCNAPISVCTLREELVVEAAAFAEMIGGNGTGVFAAKRSSINKPMMRQHLERSKFSAQPEFLVFRESDLGALEEFRQKFDRVVIKPAVGTASIGVFELPRHGSSKECVQAVKASLDKATKDYIREAERVYLAEEYVDGPLVSYDAVVSAQRVHFVGSLEFGMCAPPSFVQESSITPARLSIEQFTLLERYASDAVQILGIQVGAIHSEWRMSEAGPKLIEIAARLPAGGIVETYHRVFGVDPISCLAAALREDPVPKVDFFAASRLFHHRVCCSSAVGLRINSIAAPQRLPNPVIELSVEAKVGDRISNDPSEPTVLYQYLTRLESDQDVEALKRFVNSLVEVETVDLSGTRRR